MFLTADFKKHIKILFEDFEIIPLYFANKTGFTWQCNVRYSDKKSPKIKVQDFLTIKKKRTKTYFGSID